MDCFTPTVPTMPTVPTVPETIVVSDDDESPASPPPASPATSPGYRAMSPDSLHAASTASATGPSIVISDDESSSDEDVPVEYDDEEPVAKRARCTLPCSLPPQVAVSAPALRGYDTTTFFCPLKRVFWQIHADPTFGCITPTFSKVEFNPEDKDWVNNATYTESEL